MRKTLQAYLLAALTSVGSYLPMSVLAQPTIDLLAKPAVMSERAQRSVLLAITRAGNRLVAAGERGFILLSDDNGASWQQAKVPVSVTLTGIHFPLPNKGWAVGHGGVILHSSDGGKTWTKQLDGKRAAELELAAAKRVAEADPDSREAQWRLKSAQRLVASGPDKPFLDLHFFDDQRGLVVGAYGLMFATDDGGRNWRSAQDQLENPRGMHLYNLSAEGSQVVIAGEQGELHYSDDGGRHFTKLQVPYKGTFFGAVTSAQGDLVVFGLRGNAFHSPDGRTHWSKLDLGLPVTLTHGIRIDDGSLILVDEMGRVLQSHDGGRSFKALPLQNPSSFTAVTQTSDGALMLSGVRGLTQLALKSNLSESQHE
ncbi:MAG: YCF48-related protein [Motiliproteus sp.]